jgi:ABC-2 type transport system ATP-binding protein
MLELVHRTGTEFGMAVIVASHLLNEIERVCDHLVAIENGQLLRSAPLGSFTEDTGTLAVEVDEDTPRLAERLARQGLSVALDGRAVLVGLAREGTYDIVRDAVADLGLPLLRIERRRHRLEDLFRDAPAGSGAAVPVAVAAAPASERPPAGPAASPPA